MNSKILGSQLSSISTIVFLSLLPLYYVNSLCLENPLVRFPSVTHRTKVIPYSSKIQGLRNQNGIVLSSDRTTSGPEHDMIFQEMPPKLVDFLIKLDNIYTESSTKIRCPFWRRRTADIIDSVVEICRFLVIRHKSLGIPITNVLGYDNEEDVRLLPPGCKAIGRHVKKNADGSVYKQRGLPIEKIMEIIQNDWKQCQNMNDNIAKFDATFETQKEKSINKGYYITGRLDSTIYRDDCLFDGPDPDMPVRGLRKYLSAASHLFDHNQSYARLISIEYDEADGIYGNGSIKAHWELGGVLMLPWKPKVKPWTGSTRYHLDESGLVAFHDESWDISVLEAFVSTMWPQWSERIWQNKNRILQT